MLENRKKVLPEEIELKNANIVDVFIFYKYLEDTEIVKKAFGITEITKQVQENISKLKKTMFINRSNFKAIKYNNKTVGFIQIAFDNHNEVRLGIVIGDKKLWNQNIGTISMKKIIKFIFDNYKYVNQIILDTAVFNVAAKKCFEKAGFKLYNQDTQRFYFKITKEDYLNNISNYL
ncbi:MAG: GNAT family N-acetyltransferase [bacterium]|nr:GNAT family N-acetyltransferase [bacterium]